MIKAQFRKVIYEQQAQLNFCRADKKIEGEGRWGNRNPDININETHYCGGEVSSFLSSCHI